MALMHAVADTHEDVARLCVAHVHHGQRSASDDEADLVRRAAEHLGLAFELHKLSVGPGAAAADLREARLEALRSTAANSGSFCVLAAHHAQDQLETVLMALARGAGPRGLVGMRMKRSMGGGVDLLRPLLHARREDITSYCCEEGIEWVDDPTNADPSTHRGLLRRDVLPALETIRSGVALRVARGTQVRLAAAEALEEAVVPPDAGRWDRSALASLDDGLRLASLFEAVESIIRRRDGLAGATLAAASEAIVDGGTHARRFEVGGGVEVLIDANVVAIRVISGV